MIGYIYIIKSKQTDKVYIGSTFYTLKQRLSGHKCNKKCTSVEILKYDDAEIELLECYDCETYEELRKKEGEYIKQYDCVNERIAGRTLKEWYEDNKEKKKEYREKNKEKIAEYSKEYYQENKEYRQEYQKEYYQENKEAKAEYQKEYSQKNKEKIAEKRNEKFTCSCGGKYTYSSKARHLKSKKHQDYFKD